MKKELFKDSYDASPFWELGILECPKSLGQKCKG
jgi:hypothetical protein